jgi:glyoxylase-like metal-dependent hydrolase (beta-lactamase superfamily II)
LEQNWILGKTIDETGLVELPVWTMLVEHEDGLVLFDTGVNIYEPSLINNKFWNSYNGFYRETPEESMEASIKRLGYNLEDVTHIVISHLHSDHDGNIHLFPNAEVWVSAREFDGIMQAYAMGRARDDLISKIEYWAHNKQHWKLVEEDQTELLPGITLFQYGRGHHHGMLCSRIDFKNHGSIFLAWDALYTSINAGPPMSVPGGVMDREGYIKTHNKIMEYVSREKLELWYGHDSRFLKRMLVETNGILK